MISNLLKPTGVILLAGIALFALSGQNSALAFQAATSTHTPTLTASPAAPVQATATLTPTATTASSPTSTPKPVATSTKTATATAVPPTATKTPTGIAATSTATPTVKSSATLTPTVKATATVTPTVKATATVTPTQTPKAPARALSPSAGTVSSISTAFIVQNADPATTANIGATFYDVTGTATGPINKTVSPNRSVVIDQRDVTGLPGSPSTYQGAVVLSSNTKVAAVTFEFGGSSALGSGFRSDTYNGMTIAMGGTNVLLPQVMKNVFDSLQQTTFNSLLAIQNTNVSASATVTVTYNGISGAPGWKNSVHVSHSNIVIPAGSSAFVDETNESVLPSDFFGAAYVTSDTTVDVIVNQNAGGVLDVYRGFTSADADTSIIVTQAVSNIFDQLQQQNYGSAIEGLTFNGGDTQVTFHFYNLFNNQSGSCTQNTVNGRFRIDLRPIYWGSCPPPASGGNTYFGPVVVTAPIPIVAISNMQGDFNSSTGVRAWTTRSFGTGSGATTAFAPILMNNYYDAGSNAFWGTALEGRFLNGTGKAYITYYAIDSGLQWTDSYDSAAEGSGSIFRWDQRFKHNATGFTLPSGLRVSAVVTSTNPFVFTVNSQAGSNTAGDAYGTFQLSVP